MAKPDMPYGLFPFAVPALALPVPHTGILAVDLSTAFKWYWRVRKWTVTMSGSFSIVINLAETAFDGSTGTSTITLTVDMSAIESFEVVSSTYGLGGIGAGSQDELSLCLANTPPTYLGQYQWISITGPIVPCSGTLVGVDSLGYTVDPFVLGPTFGAISGTGISRTMFCPYYASTPYMTRDPASGLFTPYLGDSTGSGDPEGEGADFSALWNGGQWAQMGWSFTGSGGVHGNVYIDLQSSPSFPFVPGYTGNGNESVIVTGSVDGHPFSANGFVEWDNVLGTDGARGTREVTRIDGVMGNAISITFTPLEYWTYTPRIDPGENPTYDPLTGAIVNNPATGVPWTTQEIISRQGP